MADLVSWLKKNVSSFQPTKSIAIRATRHMRKIEQKKLFSDEIEHMRTAEGRWFENIIYELFVEMAMDTDHIQYMALKGADAPRGGRRVRLGQNGLFYSRCGDITVRGNGQDLAEFDLLLVDGDKQVVFGEVVTSASDIKEFEKEIEYKKRLLGYLFDQDDVTFLLISSFDITNYAAARRILKSPSNLNIQTRSCEEIKAGISRQTLKGGAGKQIQHPKLIRAPDIPLTRPFDYQRYHDTEKIRVFEGVSSHIDFRNAGNGDDTSQLVKKILYGALYPSAIRSLCREHEITVKGKKIEYDDIRHQFSKVVLATDLPGYEPLLYLRSRKRQEYLKMVQIKSGNFKFERITPSKVGFFMWLESLSPALGARISDNLLDAFSQKK
ncbi:MAG TPA: hypothetical protein VMW63_10190 [Methanoregulaceae archaeon]|nr:hypothetical protein [Methanoregulaceae archaeon]